MACPPVVGWALLPMVASTPAVPPFKPGRGGKNAKRVEFVEVKRRGKGNAFGVNIPQEPLMRAKLKPGARLKVSVRSGIITLRG